MQWNCWSLICSWSIACRRCSNCIFVPHLILGFNTLRKDSFKPRRETFKFRDLVRLISDILRYVLPALTSFSSVVIVQTQATWRQPRVFGRVKLTDLTTCSHGHLPYRNSADMASLINVIVIPFLLPDCIKAVFHVTAFHCRLSDAKPLPEPK